MKDSKRTRLGLLGSLGFHLLLFLILALTGVFATFHAVDPGSEILDVSVYDVNGGGHGGGGGGGGGGGNGGTEAILKTGSGKGEGTQSSAADDKIVENNKEPSANAKADNANAAPENNSAASGNAGEAAAGDGGNGEGSGESSGSGGGSGGGIGTGNGPGIGSGTGPGTGSGSGGGNGSGTGTGDGSGIGPGSGSGTGGGFGDGYGGTTSSPEVPPRKVSGGWPPYPESARAAGQEGTTRVCILVGYEGEVESASVAGSSGVPALDSAAVDACSNWSFTSARNSAGQKVRCYIYVPIVFRLR